MKKILIAHGGIALAFIVIAGAFVANAIYAGARLDVSSKAYVDRVVPEIVTARSADSVKQAQSCASKPPGTRSMRLFG
jgi:hypothetical protein